MKSRSTVIECFMTITTEDSSEPIEIMVCGVVYHARGSGDSPEIVIVRAFDDDNKTVELDDDQKDEARRLLIDEYRYTV